MNTEIFELKSYMLAAIFALLASLSAYRYKQAKGSSTINGIMADLGGGSFTHLIFAKLRQLMWGALQIVFLLLALFAAMWPTANHNSKTSPDADTGIASPSHISPNKDAWINGSDKESSIEKEEKRAESPRPTSGSTQAQQTVPSGAGEPRVHENDQQLTKSKVLAMETEKQYFGDDPIVRRRLGLPEVSSISMDNE